ncbi:cold-shock protein [Streptomyces sp. NPDC048606]|uniref:cold-shock protein n=1 Tax=Streptomyces sp. NPDC048606 TaxID=3154726 RepID=UPI0034252C07
MADRQLGTVKWFNDEKGFGFITPAGEGQDLLVQTKDIESYGFKSLKEGEAVSFVAEKTAKGMQAVQVRQE